MRVRTAGSIPGAQALVSFAVAIKVNMANPKYTGISAITGRVVSIRHATERDLFLAEKMLLKQGRKGEIPAGAEVVVAVEEDRVIGLGILRRSPEADPEARLTLYEDTKRRGIGAQVVGHLLEHAPVKIVNNVDRAPQRADATVRRRRRKIWQPRTT